MQIDRDRSATVARTRVGLHVTVLISMFAWGYSPSFAATALETVASQPNIIFILTDDHRWDSYQAGGNSIARTPHLDRIAKSGTRFETAFVTLAICSPSRAACLTGRYGSANGVTAVGKTSLNSVESDATCFQSLKADHGLLFMERSACVIWNSA